jgi:hypothetical protein
MPQASDTFIVAEHDTAFEAVGFSFGYVDSVGSKADSRIFQELQTERAGLTILAADGYPKQPIHELLKDVATELKILDFTAGNDMYAPSATITKILAEQGVMSAYVHDTPALVALMPDHAGW